MLGELSQNIVVIPAVQTLLYSMGPVYFYSGALRKNGVGSYLGSDSYLSGIMGNQRLTLFII